MIPIPGLIRPCVRLRISYHTYVTYTHLIYLKMMELLQQTQSHPPSPNFSASFCQFWSLWSLTYPPIVLSYKWGTNTPHSELILSSYEVKHID